MLFFYYNFSSLTQVNLNDTRFNFLFIKLSEF